jgi:hypothetical protein
MKQTKFTLCILAVSFLMVNVTALAAGKKARSKQIPNEDNGKKTLVFDLNSAKARPTVISTVKQPSSISNAPILLGEASENGGDKQLSEKTMIIDEAKRNKNQLNVGDDGDTNQDVSQEAEKDNSSENAEDQ